VDEAAAMAAIQQARAAASNFFDTFFSTVRA
jgi:hypothetical protein